MSTPKDTPASGPCTLTPVLRDQLVHDQLVHHVDQVLQTGPISKPHKTSGPFFGITLFLQKQRRHACMYVCMHACMYI